MNKQHTKSQTILRAFLCIGIISCAAASMAAGTGDIAAAAQRLVQEENQQVGKYQDAVQLIHRNASTFESKNFDAHMDTISADCEARTLLVKRLTRLKAVTLKKYLKDSNPTLRLAAIGAAKNKKSRELALPLSALIADSDKKIGVAANRALQEITGQYFGSVANASFVKRAGIQKKWETWAENN